MSRTPMEGPGSRRLARSFLTSGARGVSGPAPERGAGPGPLAWWGKNLTGGPRLLRPLSRSYERLRGSCLAAVEVGIPAIGYRQMRCVPICLLVRCLDAILVLSGGAALIATRILPEMEPS
jgi:hypothetical protein